jgi:hypothetical protein
VTRARSVSRIPAPSWHWRHDIDLPLILYENLLCFRCSDCIISRFFTPTEDVSGEGGAVNTKQLIDISWRTILQAETLHLTKHLHCHSDVPYRLDCVAHMEVDSFRSPPEASAPAHSLSA